MSTASVQLSAGLAGIRAALDAYREEVVLGRADPRFAAAREQSARIMGYTTSAELCLLYHLAVAARGPGRIVEIGSYLGRSTIVLASACADEQREPVIAVDPHTAALGIEGLPTSDTLAEFLANVTSAGMREHVELRHATSVEAAKSWGGEPVRLQFVDGWHSYDAVMEDVGSWAQWFTPACCVVLDDYMVSEGVRQAVHELQNRGTIPRTGAVVGKMAAFGPPQLLEQAPVPPGGRALMKIDPNRREKLIKLTAR
jgi:predicted O-methyltransferase YrrM